MIPHRGIGSVLSVSSHTDPRATPTIVDPYIYGQISWRNNQYL